MFARTLTLPALVLIACGGGQEVGSVGVDWTGNDIAIEAMEDPEVSGVVCHVSYFDRGFIDRVQQGNWFEDPSFSAVDCNAGGPVVIGDIDLDKNGEEIFRQARSLVWKSLRISRIYDKKHNSLVYLAHVREVHKGSGKMSLSVVPLTGLDVTWSGGKPQ